MNLAFYAPKSLRGGRRRLQRDPYDRRGRGEDGGRNRRRPRKLPPKRGGKAPPSDGFTAPSPITDPPLPAPPLLGIPLLAIVGAGYLLWEIFDSRPRQQEAEKNFNNASGTLEAARFMEIRISCQQDVDLAPCQEGQPPYGGNGSTKLGPFTVPIGWVRSYSNSTKNGDFGATCGATGLAEGTITVNWTNSAGQAQDPRVFSFNLSSGGQYKGSIKHFPKVEAIILSGNPVPFPPDPEPLPWITQPFPIPLPLEEPAEPLTQPEFLPGIAPPLPQAPPFTPFAPDPTDEPTRPPLLPPGSPNPGAAPGTGTQTRPRPLLPPPLIEFLPDGQPQEQRPQPPRPQIPPGVEQTPDGPIGQPGTPPPPTLTGIAAEVGRIEQKARQLLNRPSPDSLLEDLLNAIKDLLQNPPYVFPGGAYTLFPPCGETSDGAPGPPKVAEWQGGEGQFLELRRRLDALAELVQHHKDLRQPICHRRAQGQELTVDFVEDRAGTWQDRPLRKRLGYRDQGGGSLESHTAGWEGYSWQAGPVQLISSGRWGRVQVYASSRGEAERVIRHAAGLAGYDPDTDPNHEWIESVHSGGRIGRTGTMVPKRTVGGIAVRWRDGPSGPSYTVSNLVG